MKPGWGSEMKKRKWKQGWKKRREMKKRDRSCDDGDGVILRGESGERTKSLSSRERRKDERKKRMENGERKKNV